MTTLGRQKVAGVLWNESQRCMFEALLAKPGQLRRLQNRVLIWSAIWRPGARAVPENKPLKLITFS